MQALSPAAHCSGEGNRQGVRDVREGDGMSGKITPGRRRDWHATKPWELEPGDYMYELHDDGKIGVWVHTPGDPGHGPCCLSTWSPKIEDDGTLTLSPSILAHETKIGPHNSHRPGESFVIPEWHGYLVAGEWREC